MDLELCDLTVEVRGGQALAQQLDAMRRGLAAASAVIWELDGVAKQ
jgi:hypothetical protein